MTFNQDIFKISRENNWFRHELITTRQSQLVLMSLNPREDIGEELHKADQILLCVAGTGTLVMNSMETKVSEGHLMFIPSGTKHNIINSSEGMMKLISIYSPPEHPPGTIHKTKAEAIYFEKKLTR